MHLEQFADKVSGTRRPGVVAIADGVALVGFDQRGPGFRANTGIVVTGKVAADFNGAFHRQCFGTRLRLAKNRRRSEHLRNGGRGCGSPPLTKASGVRSITKSADILKKNSGRHRPAAADKAGRSRPKARSGNSVLAVGAHARLPPEQPVEPAPFV